MREEAGGHNATRLYAEAQVHRDRAARAAAHDDIDRQRLRVNGEIVQVQ